MSLSTNEEIIIKLGRENDAIAKRLLELEKQLTEDQITAQKEIIGLLEKREEIEKTQFLLSGLEEIENLVEDEYEKREREAKESKALYAKRRIPFIQAQIANYDPGRVKDKNSVQYANYAAGQAYYLSKLAELTADLDI